MNYRNLMINLVLRVYKKFGLFEKLDNISKDRYVTKNYLRFDEIQDLNTYTHYKIFKFNLKIEDVRKINKAYIRRFINKYYKKVATETNAFHGGLISSNQKINNNTILFKVCVVYKRVLI